MRSFFRTRLSLVVASFTFAFVLAEIAVRAIGAYQGIDYRLYGVQLFSASRIPKGLEYYYREGNYARLSANFQGIARTSDFQVLYQTNSKGFRDREYSYEKPPGKTRFVAVGDSFLFGEGVPYGQRFTEIFEDADPHREVLNMGVPGSGIDQDLLLFLKDGLPFQPDHLLVFLSEASTADNRRIANFVVNGEVVIPPNATVPTPPQYLQPGDPFFYPTSDKKVLRYSHFLSLAGYVATSWLLRNRIEWQTAAGWKGVGAIMRKRDTYRVPLPVSRAEHVAAVLRKFDSVCRARQIKLTAVSIDPLTEISELKKRIPNIELLDFSGALTERARTTALRFKYDGHFNPGTHRLIGDRLVASALQSVL